MATLILCCRLLQMHLDFADRSDEAVLQIYPSTIRRRVLRHLYHTKLAKAYLFNNCPRKFLDVILASATIETFMPKVVAAGTRDLTGQ